MNYYVTGNNVDLNLGEFELKCEKCKRVLDIIEQLYQSITISHQ